MKVRLAKKILTPPNYRNGKFGYWRNRYDCMRFGGYKDHRVIKAIRLIKKKKQSTEKVKDVAAPAVGLSTKTLMALDGVLLMIAKRLVIKSVF